MVRNVVMVGAALLVAWLALGRGGGDIDGTTARSLVAAGAMLLDVRTAEEYGAGHIDGAVNVPVDQVPRRLDELGPRERAMVVYCRSGRRSADAVAVLRRAGFANVHDLGGMGRW